MKINYFLAIDIGASGGRHILGYIDENNKLSVEEVYRFKNGVSEIDNHLCWDLDYLFSEIVKGIKKCKEINKIPVSMAIDTWGVDFVLLDKDNNTLGNAVSYRDKRTFNIPEQVYKIISKEELYNKTGIQNKEFNTIYQLYSMKDSGIFNKADTFLMMPDYFNFLLTGKKNNEYTNASTTQLLNVSSCQWDTDILNKLKIPKHIFQNILQPGTFVGMLKDDIKEIVGFDLEVVTAPSHDTASAVLSVPTEKDDFLYMSSGTWSLLGIESEKYNNSLDSLKLNFTNEGGYNHKYRYLKNIMGLWIIQNIKKELNNKYSFEELSNMARELNDSNVIIDVNDNAFFSPSSMIDTIKDYCKTKLNYETKSINDIVNIVYNSLCHSYHEAIKEVEFLSGKKMGSFFIIGGGSQDNYLNSLIAKKTNMHIFSGPVEATSIGNIICQMLNKGVFSSVKEARKCISYSFDIKQYN
ncbi:rhamnulokinase family protein [uncultured Brachyspira sp.]|uniref:rhamnulokinase n=1 Tax=uncultured Brachyspira sp. TaxID=221953 RepID=UPI002601E111|nr:rhamnulokinase family protein [uncultured Brachyspira sp.]